MSIHVFELDRLGIRVFYSPASTGTSRKQTTIRDPILSNCSHKHAYFELHIIEAGSLRIRAETHEYECHAGQFYLLCPGTVHAPQMNAAEVCTRFCIHFELLANDAPLSSYIIRKSRQSGIFIGNASALLPLVDELKSDTCQHPLFSEELIHQLLSQLFIQLARNLPADPCKETAINSNLSDVRTIHIDQYFNNRFYSSDGEEILAKELGVSRRQLNRIIQGIYGKSYREKLLEVRMEAACELLCSDLSIREIAERMGYSSSANFTVFFKQAVGITPSAYRRKINS